MSNSGTMDNPVFIRDELCFVLDKDTPSLPVDRFGRTLYVGDTIKLNHNNRIGKIRMMTYCGNGNWIIGLNIDGGGFLLPQSKDNILKLVMR